MQGIPFRPRNHAGLVVGLRLAMLAIALTIATGAVGCAPEREPTNPEPPASEPRQDAEGQDDTSVDGDAVQVLMLGRSVMRGWFDHWGYDGESPVERKGYALQYREIESPPGIAESAAAAVAEAPAGSIVFFKLCFVDFETGHPASVTKARLSNMHDWLVGVIAAAHDNDVTLILGNALPRVRAETTGALTDMHRAYNEDAGRLAAGSDNVYVFDLYGPLTDEGALRDDYAASPDDSHLNDAAYSMLDEAFFAELDRITGR